MGAWCRSGAEAGSGFLRRAGLLLVVVAGLLVTPAAASAGVAVSVEAAPSSAADERCVGPCAVGVFFKGNGAGRVTSTPAGLDCRADCGVSFPEGATVTVRATPDPGSQLAVLEGCPVVTSDGTCQLVMADLFFLCPVFVADGGSAPPPTPCPPTSALPPPPPPPPAGPPPAGSACTIIGSPGPDIIRGTAGNDVICGRGGNDRIQGGGGHDLLLGGGGAERITGGRGRDRLVGGPGADVLYARDGAADVVSGGRGRDRARVDGRDTVRSVERRF